MNEPGLYTLDANRCPIPCNDILDWGKWMSRHDRRVERSRIAEGIYVSTVFLGVDHGFGDHPVLFETMVFGGECDQLCLRTRSWSEAEEIHWVVVDAQIDNALKNRTLTGEK